MKYPNSCFLKILSRHPSHSILRKRVLVREGCTAVLRMGSITPYEADIHINNIIGISNCADKIKMKQIFKEAGVISPEFYTDHVELLDYYDFSKPIICKRTHRSKGKGMVKIDTREEFESFVNSKIKNNNYNKKNPYYFERFYNYVKEYRLHVSCVGEYFYTNRKMLRTEANNRWYRNDSNSVWILESNELFNKPATWNNIVADCQKARKALGIDICSFDIKVNKKGQHVILEANSASSFGDATPSIVATKYQFELIKILNKKWP